MLVVIIFALSQCPGKRIHVNILFTENILLWLWTEAPAQLTSNHLAHILPHRLHAYRREMHLGTISFMYKTNAIINTDHSSKPGLVVKHNQACLWAHKHARTFVHRYITNLLGVAYWTEKDGKNKETERQTDRQIFSFIHSFIHSLIYSFIH